MTSSKPKDGIKEKLKTFFNITKDDSDSPEAPETSTSSRGNIRRRSAASSVFITPSVLRSIGPNFDIPSRLKSLKELEPLVSTKLLEDGAVEKLWLSIQDLVQSPDLEQRRAGVEFIIAICKGQRSRMGLCRLMFFEHLKIVASTNGNLIGGNFLILYTNLLKALCGDGQDIRDFEEDIGPFCLAFLYEHIRQAVDSTGFLRLLQTLIKLHAVYFDDVMRDIVRYVCIVACRLKSDSSDEIICCLNVLDTILRYGCWPSGVLLVVVTALCKLINVKELCEPCWTLMRTLLSSQYGNGTVYTMCSLMEAAAMYPDEGVLRGAVFFVGNSLWGPERVECLRHTPGAVLPFIMQSLTSGGVIVAYEVALSVQRLIHEHGENLQLMTWDLVLNTLERIFDVTKVIVLPAANAVIKVSHDILTEVEKLYETHRFNGSTEQLFSLVQDVAKHRPEASILLLMAYRTQSLSPSKGNWLSQLHVLLDTYYNGESRSNIRIEAVRILRNVFVKHRHLHGDEMVEVVVLPVFSEAARESDYDVQASVINLLIDMAKTSAQNCFFELLTVVERIINTGLETFNSATTSRDDWRQFFVNVECALAGLVEIIVAKWSSTPATEALYALDLLTSHLVLQYSRGVCDESGSSARRSALKFLLSLGVETGTQRLTYKEPMTGQLVASAYIVCIDSDNDASPPHSPVSSSAANNGRLTNFSAKEVIKAFAMCIQKERQWLVLQLLLAEMPSFLLNRKLALSDVDNVAAICSSAIRLVTDPTSVLPVTRLSDRLTADDVKENVYALLTSLIPFRSYFDAALQRKLATTIQQGIVNQKSSFAVISTINCLFEMPDVMASTIPGLVRRLSELPPAPTIAISVVELLSTLMRMYDLYTDFVAEDYENVLKTLTSYVDPFMLTDFIVAVAYQIIFRWFLRAPQTLRPRLAKYALNRIDGILRKNAAANERSLSDPLLRQAYDDAREVCITFFAYYSFTDEVPSYERSPIARQLFDNNGSLHWIVGDRIFSITPSGNENGCMNCSNKRPQKEQIEKPSTPKGRKDEFLEKRRRHVSAVQKPVTGAPQAKPRLAADDTCIASTAATQQAQGLASLMLKEKSIAEFEKACNPLCFCWCWDWIELTIRHAVGRQAWLVRTNNASSPVAAPPGFLDTLAILACGDAEEGEDERETAADDEMESGLHQEGRHGERRAVSNSTSKLSSTVYVNDDASGAGMGDLSKKKESRSVLTIRIDDNAATEPSIISPRRFSQAKRHQGQTVPSDVRSVLLQLFSANIGRDIGSDGAIITALTGNESVQIAIKNLDRISPYEAHKIGVIYIGLRQTTEVEILGNQFGSPRYETFLSGLGTLISLKESDPAKIYLGGLDTKGKDGEFTYHWSDQSSQVTFHIATRMPNRENDPNFQQKKSHIGNDFVTIVFNESGDDYKLSTISGQFARVAIVVEPLDEKILRIKLVAANEISSWLGMKEATMSDELAPLLCRQMAQRADASARIWEQKKSTPSGEPVLARTAERLRQIKSIKERFGEKPLTVTNMFD